jgi:hypothetical protein
MNEQTRASAALFRERALAVGMPVAGPGGEIIRPKAGRRPKGRTVPMKTLPAVIDLDVGRPEADHTVRLIDGNTVVEMRPAALTVGLFRLNTWFADKVAALVAEAATVDDPAEINALSARIEQLQEAQLRCFFPELPVGAMQTLAPRHFGTLWDTVRALIAEASPPDDESPNDAAA